MENIFLLCIEFCCISNNKDLKDVKDNYKNIKEQKEFNVIFLYDGDDEKIDKNIHKILFYDQYKNQYKEKNIEENIENKEILLIYNKNNINITNIVNYIHENNGLLIKNKKWTPKYIWIFN